MITLIFQTIKGQNRFHWTGRHKVGEVIIPVRTNDNQHCKPEVIKMTQRNANMMWDTLVSGSPPLRSSALQASGGGKKWS